MRNDLERKAAVCRDALLPVSDLPCGAQLDFDIFAAAEADAGSDEAIAIKRNEFQRDCTRAVPRNDRMGNDPREGRHFMILGGECHSPGRSSRIGSGIEHNVLESPGPSELVVRDQNPASIHLKSREHFFEVLTEGLCPDPEGHAARYSLSSQPIPYRAREFR